MEDLPEVKTEKTVVESDNPQAWTKKVFETDGIYLILGWPGSGEIGSEKKQGHLKAGSPLYS